MTKVVKINDRGTLTLPKDLRDRLGLKGSGQLVVIETPDGLLLRPGAAFPIEIYSEERLAEFERANEKALAGYRLKLRKK